MSELSARLLTELSRCTAHQFVALCAEEWANTLIPGLKKLIGCDQGHAHHLEGDVALHTGLALVHLRGACRRRLNREPSTVELLAAVIHDLKKPECRVEDGEAVRFPGHEEMAARECAHIGSRCQLSTDEQQHLTFLVEEHGAAHKIQKLPAERREALLVSRHALSLALLQEADALATIGERSSSGPVLWSALTENTISPSYFDTPVDRRAYHSVKWNTYPEDVLPLWVADMDFRSSPAIIEALQRRVDHADFGYEYPSRELSAAITTWCAEQYNWSIDETHIVPLPGLVCGLNVVARAVGEGNGSTIVFTPVYPPFLSAPPNNGMETIEVPLEQKLQTDQTFAYALDLDAFERVVRPDTKLCILCHPHNPSGEAWEPTELSRLAEICAKRNITLCSDEIHCDLILDGSRHVPTALVAPTLRDNLITLMAPSKTFNVPGLGFSFAIIQSEALRKRFIKAADGITPHPNALGLAACEAAFTQSKGWLKAAREYIAANRDLAVSFIQKHLPKVKVTNPQRTYLLWLDCRQLGDLGASPSAFLQRDGKVALNDGATFGVAGTGFARLNLATQRSTLLAALHRMKDSLDKRK